MTNEELEKAQRALLDAVENALTPGYENASEILERLTGELDDAGVAERAGELVSGPASYGEIEGLEWACEWAWELLDEIHGLLKVAEDKLTPEQLLRVVERREKKTKEWGQMAIDFPMPDMTDYGNCGN